MASTSVCEGLPYVASSRGACRVYSYDPPEGGPGTTISARMTFVMRTAETTYMRLVIGRRALTTAVQQVAEHGRKILQLQASVPLDAFTIHASVVALTVQALNSRDEILDSCTFGAFHYSPPREHICYGSR